MKLRKNSFEQSTQQRGKERINREDPKKKEGKTQSRSPRGKGIKYVPKPQI
jgi:hypothetical protein